MSGVKKNVITGQCILSALHQRHLKQNHEIVYDLVGHMAVFPQCEGLFFDH